MQSHSEKIKNITTDFKKKIKNPRLSQLRYRKKLARKIKILLLSLSEEKPSRLLFSDT
jgi:hypothetical protein